MIYLGDYAASSTVYFKWNTFDGDGASITRSGDGTLRIYKNGSTTQRSSANGITSTEDFHSLTGVHHVTIDLSDNSDAGFYAAGSEYAVVFVGMTIDSQTVNAVIAHFSIGRTVTAISSANLALINAEVVDALNTDTYAEPGQEAPGATVSLAKKIGYLYKAWRNLSTQTATSYKLYNDAGSTVDHKATTSSDGTTFTRNEIATGP